MIFLTRQARDITKIVLRTAFQYLPLLSVILSVCVSQSCTTIDPTRGSGQ